MPKVEARLSFPNLFEASAFEPNQKPKFGATLIVAKGSASHQAIKDAVRACIAEKWPKGPPPGLKLCLRDGGEKGHMDGFGDEVVFFNATNPKRPTVVDRDRTPLTESDGKPYAGCYVTALIDFWAQDNQYGKRVNATLTGVQFVRDGEAFGGARVASADDFDVLDDDGGGAPAGQRPAVHETFDVLA